MNENKNFDFYPVLNPTVPQNANGTYTVEVNNRYGALDTYRAAEVLGLVTLHRVGGNDLAASYGYTELVYSIN